MKTLKLVLTLAIFLVAINIQAQDKKTTFGVKAVLNISNVGSSDGNYDNTKAKAGFHAGIILDYAFTQQWHLLTGLEYTTKGVKIELNPDDQKVTAAYIQLPVSAGLKLNITDALGILIDLGPYFAYGVHGKIKEGNFEQDTFSDIALKRFDCGMNFGASLELQKFSFRLGGELGFVNVMQDGNDKAENRNFTLSVAYKF